MAEVVFVSIDDGPAGVFFDEEEDGHVGGHPVGWDVPLRVAGVASEPMNAESEFGLEGRFPVVVIRQPIHG